jgi:heterodisulfide reductase subunit A
MGKHIVVIGGGVAGIESGGQLAKGGNEVTIVEKSNNTGGHLNDWYRLFPDRRNASEVKEYLDVLTGEKGIKILLNTTIEYIKKNGSHFTLGTKQGEKLIADAVIIATGFDLFKSERKEEYGYGIYNNVITSADLEIMFRSGKILTDNGTEPKKI